MLISMEALQSFAFVMQNVLKIYHVITKSLIILYLVILPGQDFKQFFLTHS